MICHHLSPPKKKRRQPHTIFYKYPIRYCIIHLIICEDVATLLWSRRRQNTLPANSICSRLFDLFPSLISFSSRVERRFRLTPRTRAQSRPILKLNIFNNTPPHRPDDSYTFGKFSQIHL